MTAHQVDTLLARSRELGRVATRLLEVGDVDGALAVTDAALDARTRAHAAIDAWAR